MPVHELGRRGRADKADPPEQQALVDQCGGSGFSIPSAYSVHRTCVADSDVDWTAVVTLVLVHRVGALIGMHVAVENDVYTILEEDRLIDGQEAIHLLRWDRI